MRAERILAVCTGNVCRSPYFESVLRVGLEGLPIHVESAGVHALVGEPMDQGSITILRRDGISPPPFSARQVDKSLVDTATLVITASRELRSSVVRLSPTALRKVFALRDLGDLLEDCVLAPVGEVNSRPVAQLVDLANAQRAMKSPRPAEASAVSDPFQRGARAFRVMADQAREPLNCIVRHLQALSRCGQ